MNGLIITSTLEGKLLGALSISQIHQFSTPSFPYNYSCSSYTKFYMSHSIYRHSNVSYLKFGHHANVHQKGSGLVRQTTSFID